MLKAFCRLLPIFVAFLFTRSLELGAIQPIIDKIPIHEAFVPKFTDIMPNQPISRQPPHPIDEYTPPQPSNDALWISGYWAWIEENQDFAWVCGVWRRPPPQHVWIPGFWINHDGGWIWAKGFWSPNNQLQYISAAPPQSVDDQVPNSPGQDYFWVRGYWQYSTSTKNYIWLSGTWEKLNPNWILAPASYIWRPEGYVFVPIYWDFPLDQRGEAYTCNAPNPPAIISPDLIIQSIYVSFPDYIFLYWHWWHFHPGWWGDCWCIPPWWFWNDWWALPWADMWGLWWWWGHPGFFPPFWLQAALAGQMPPPPIQLIQFLENVQKPNFPIIPGKKPLLPEGPEEQGPLPKPQIPNDVTPGGTVTPPNFPDIASTPEQVIPPPPPQSQWQQPERLPPNYPPPTEYTPLPQYYPEPSYPKYPPRPYPKRPKQPKPNYPIPPQDGRWPHRPPTRPPEADYPETDYTPQPSRPPQKKPYYPNKPSFKPQPYYPDTKPSYRPAPNYPGDAPSYQRKRHYPERQQTPRMKKQEELRKNEFY